MRRSESPDLFLCCRPYPPSGIVNTPFSDLFSRPPISPAFSQMASGFHHVGESLPTPLPVAVASFRHVALVAQCLSLSLFSLPFLFSFFLRTQSRLHISPSATTKARSTTTPRRINHSSLMLLARLGFIQNLIWPVPVNVTRQAFHLQTLYLKLTCLPGAGNADSHVNKSPSLSSPFSPTTAAPPAADVVITHPCPLNAMIILTNL